MKLITPGPSFSDDGPGGVVGGWVPMHCLVTATVRFGCDNKKY